MKWSLIPLVLSLAACDATPPPQPKTDPNPNPNPVFETQIQEMKKARAVEGQVMDAATAQRKQIDDASQQ